MGIIEKVERFLVGKMAEFVLTTALPYVDLLPKKESLEEGIAWDKACSENVQRIEDLMKKGLSFREAKDEITWQDGRGILNVL